MSKYQTLEGIIVFPESQFTNPLSTALFNTVLYKNYVEGNGECNLAGQILEFREDEISYIFSDFWLRNYNEIESDLLSLLLPDSGTEINLLTICTDGDYMASYYHTEDGKLIAQHVSDAPREVVTEEV